ncbi:adenine phosphoribosyltransferase [Brevibacillus sp. 7WMA2]|uniref:Adenine phosphoribosyltransferase n=3 Tax=Brevibacillus TaxID=55080 RepID=A0A075R2J1_BRELA|nr:MULTISPECIES: adenine phosphoribosyltransferase [Brevibacillus]AIG25631.1 adenine phosphoribosyltransferase [Brevibacillus laterosporus LMG 15441]AKF94978.1 adenine phosphoribosyltransferase [Brevibacillus laterosporus]ATO50603.1 adenine phosphoribosyltransferase [Brevibacillus laterosporus DSM 25]AUM64187.1 adenine phosphoribosyltransferase [Brevibacillus laterosporus]AYB39198.1 adenine phosphoribosyltransferase [Brevibacillus laterosporus]
MNFKDYIRVIPDYPQPGIRFKDITTLLKDGPVYKAAINELKTFADTLNVDVIAGPEARGFVVGAPLSYAMNVGFIPIRKANKLPYKAIQADYSLEYGSDALAMHEDAIKPGDRVLIADDLLATGGTIETSINLVEQLGGIVVGAVFLIELSYLDGREKLGDIPVSSLITY